MNRLATSLQGATITALALLIGSCSVLPGASEYDLYRLGEPSRSASEQSAGTTHETPVAGTLRILPPSGNDLIRGSRLLIALDDYRLSAYAGARWAAPIPTVWSDHLVDTFQHADHLTDVVTDSARLRTDWELNGHLYAFQVQLTGGRGSKPAYALIDYDAYLIQTADRTLAASRRFRATAPLAEDHPAAAVAALTQASQALAREVVEWVAARTAAARLEE